MVHQVVKAPSGDGPVYTVAPADDRANAKWVYRTLLKAVAGLPVPNDTSAPSTSPANLPVRQDEL